DRVKLCDSVTKNKALRGRHPPEVDSDQSSSSDVIHTIVPPDHQVSEHNSKWTKDHPFENIFTMQEELHEFERLEVWELVPPPNKAFVFSLKWIYKVKLDELGGILKKRLGWSLVVIAKRRELILKSHSLRLQD
ncbi:hypothetical protein Tco_0993998, partial [Tanacetum coccineum]